jgi:UDPglucose 6-dehydrogenase
VNISIIGCGYVGIVTGVCLADNGHKVYFFDNDKKKLSKFKNGEKIISEKNLTKKILSAKKKKNIFFCDSLDKALNKTTASFICVGTPLVKGNINLKYIKNVTEGFSKILNKKKTHTIIYKSTIPPQTVDNFCIPILKKKLKNKLGLNFKVISNPEFLREGNAIYDFENPERIIIGIQNPQSKKIMQNIYSKYKKKSEILFVDIKTAEFIKYFSNSFFSLLISFSNEISNLSHKMNIDFIEVLNAFKLDNRFKSKGNKIPEVINYLKPGIGYGGSCFPKDIKTFINFAKKNKRNLEILQKVDDINLKQPKIISNQITKEFLKRKINTCLVLGITFKDGTNDIRNSTSIKLINFMSKNKFKIYMYDPFFNEYDYKKNKKFFHPQVKFLNNVKKNLKVDSIILNNKSKKTINIVNYYNKKYSTLIYDSRRVLDKTKIRNYLGVSIKKFE